MSIIKIFKSPIGASIVELIFLTLGYSIIIYLFSFYVLDFRFSQINDFAWTVILLLYISACYIYTGLTTNDIILYEDRLEIVSNIPLFKKHLSFPLSEIQSAQFRHEWTETIWQNTRPVFLAVIVKFLYDWIFAFLFPINYKWIKITKNQAHKFYCFGIEMDTYDNAGPLFEDLFYSLAKKGIKVSWTDNSDTYYAFMNTDAERILKAQGD